METVVIGTAIPFATDKTTTCHFLKTSFSYTAPIFTDTGENPYLRKSRLLEYHHLDGHVDGYYRLLFTMDTPSFSRIIAFLCWFL